MLVTGGNNQPFSFKENEVNKLKIFERSGDQAGIGTAIKQWAEEMKKDLKMKVIEIWVDYEVNKELLRNWKR